MKMSQVLSSGKTGNNNFAPRKYADPKTNPGFARDIAATHQHVEPLKYIDPKTNPSLFRSNAVRRPTTSGSVSSKGKTPVIDPSQAAMRSSYEDRATEQEEGSTIQEDEAQQASEDAEMEMELYSIITSSQERLVRAETEKSLRDDEAKRSPVRKFRDAVKRIFGR